MANFLQTLALVSVIPLSFPLGAYAHMEMRWPYAFRSKYDPAITDPDYDNTFPLSTDGSNYPCHGYQNLASSQVSKVTYTPGQTYNLTLAGTAMHEGGSCQISLSYDNGQSFRVIKSLIGGCSLKYDWDFTVPSNAPASDDAILAWTWFNIVGNREMYMSCARVSVAGQSVQRYQRYQRKRQGSFDALPENFACNIGNGCTTIEDREVVFPNPGDVIEYNSDAITPEPGPGFTLTATPTGNAFSTVAPNATATTAPYAYPNGTTTYYGPTGTGTGSPFPSCNSTCFNSTVTLLTASSRTTSFSAYMTSTTASPTAGFFYPLNGTNTSTPMTTAFAPTSTPFFANTTTTTQAANQTTTMSTSSSTTAATITSSTAPTATILPSACTPGSFACNSTTTFSQCVPGSTGSGTYVFMGSVAAGMQCVNGTIERENDGPCTPNGSLQCDGEFAFYLCDQGGLIDMGPVASGTACRNGTIVLV